MVVLSVEPQPPIRKSRLTTLTFLNLGLLVLLFLLETFIAERWWWTTALTYMPQQLFIVPSLLLLLITLVRRKWVLTAWNLLAATFCLCTLLGVNIPLRFDTPQGPPLRVMTWNINHFSRGAPSVSEVIVREQPDILCLQEVNDESTGKASLALRGMIPGWYALKAEETAIFSRYPIVEQRIRPLPGLQRVLLEAVVEAQGRRLTVINAHISTSSTVESLTNRAHSIPDYLRQTAQVRSRQFETICDITSHSPYPVMIAGDFNTPPRGVLYRQIAARYPDAFRTAGWGAGYTYPAHFPVLQIDHFFIDKRISVARCYRSGFIASDHYAMISDLILSSER